MSNALRHRLDALTAPCGLTLTPSDTRSELAEARREARHWRLMFRAAMDAFALVATVPERYEQMQRDLRHERHGYMAAEFARLRTPSHEAGEDSV